MSTAPLPIAAVVYPPTLDVGAVMRAAAAALASRGVAVGGVVTCDARDAPDESCEMELEDVSTGARFSITQNLGSGSEACRLDPGALARAAVAVRHAIEDGAELVLFNKFGAQEAGGSGLRAEMGLAAARGTPLLTTVAERFVPDWQTFTGGDSTLLPPDVDAVLAWWQAVSTARK
ncbi:DUF2478 domain-containing protein [Pseudothauera rhizosphaerae]|uniref:DUF2478 domain-containing protein n=1 Tax=Pseudothauera rhizosphaerae TaxID=2565932 RepID=A0A4S4A8C5_9RHOO|nr:DUF2478 domain-containing protein [Pseudothauera rhizosphaerae]THF54786.1 DUF2478 domain-containing protein [Pseudothauera rhizosphaerae]